MIKKLKQAIFCILTTVITIALYLKIQPELYRWSGIFIFMIIAIMLAETILGEEPLEFFDNFGNYRKAKISAILMLIAAISVVMMIISFFSQAII